MGSSPRCLIVTIVNTLSLSYQLAVHDGEIPEGAAFGRHKAMAKHRFVLISTHANPFTLMMEINRRPGSEPSIGSLY